MLKTYGFLSKLYKLWASFFQFIISRNLFYWIAPQRIFTSSQKKISTKNFENEKSWRYFLKNFRNFWDFWHFWKFSKFSKILYRTSYRKKSKILKIFENFKNLKISQNFRFFCENFSESISNFSNFQNFSSRFFFEMK